MYTGFSKTFNYELEAYNDIYDCKQYTLHYALEHYSCHIKYI